jgi:dolichyl-phosphate beta-glucosyltransferase
MPGRYHILRLPHNLGKGGAVRAGMLQAQGEYIFFIDADGSTPIHEIDTFQPYLSSDDDIYIGVRTIKHEAPLRRRFFGYGYISLANFLLNMHVADFTCGFKCYRRDVARLVFSRQTLNNWSFDAEDLCIAQQHGCRIKEIPVHWTHRGGSKVRVLRNVIMCGLDLVRICYNQRRQRYAR